MTMIEVLSMQPYDRDTTKCESYVTTPRSGGDESPFNSVTLTRERIYSAPLHILEHATQALTEKLASDSEQNVIFDRLAFETTVADDWSEAARGWKCVCPYAKYLTSHAVLKSKTENQLKKEASVRKLVQCVDEELTDNFLSCSWKGCVEPVTYRYIANNGYYRKSKISKSDVRESILLRKSRSEKSLVTPDLRQTQKSLKRDLDSQLKTEESVQLSHSTTNIRVLYRNQEAMNDVVETSASQSEADTVPVLYRNQRAVATTVTSALQDKHPCVEKGIDMSNLYKTLIRKDRALFKSASDLFMENFKSRISALEKEIQTPCLTLKKAGDSSQCLSKVQTIKKGKEGRAADNVKPGVQSVKPQGKDFVEDLFTVIPVKRDLLKPLEKLTTKHRHMEKAVVTQGGALLVQARQEEGSEGEEGYIHVSASSRPQSLLQMTNSAAVSGMLSGLTAARCDSGKKHNLQCSSNNPKECVPRPFCIVKGSSAQVQRTGSLHYTDRYNRFADQAVAQVHGVHIAEDMPSSVNQKPVKEFDSVSIGAQLPEIMGKKLTVTVTNHRLL